MGNRMNSMLAGVCACFLTACATNNAQDDVITRKPTGQKGKTMAVAVLSPTQGNDVKGQVTFLEETQGVRVTANITGLTPGKHGFHIHEKGDCSSTDGSSAGGHWNPTGMKHGGPTSGEHHIGDLGNITANDEGVARFERVFPFLSFTGANTFLGKAVIVHQKADDLESQPTGDAGGRLACGVIGKVSK